MQSVKSIAFAIAGIALIAGGYVFYRYSRLPDLANDSLATLLTLPPFYCTFGHGSFDAGGSGMVYVANGMLRGREVEAGALDGYMANQFIDQSGNTYLWVDDKSKGVVIPASAATLSVSFADSLSADHTSFASLCYPWWFPNSSYFSLPSDKTFATSSLAQ